MVLASPGPLLTPPPSSSPLKTPFLLRHNSTPLWELDPRQAAAAAAGGDGAWEARTGPRQTQRCCDTPATARLRRGSPLMTLQPTKRQPATVGAVERGGRVTTARQTSMRAAPGCSPPPTYARWRCTEAAHNAHFYRSQCTFLQSYSIALRSQV